MGADSWTHAIIVLVAENNDDAVNAAYVVKPLAGDCALWCTSGQAVETSRATRSDATSVRP